MTNLIQLTDSYKLSHFNQYPEGTEKVHSYMEARAASPYPATLFFGLQYYLKQYLSQGVHSIDVKEAEELAEFHGVPFNRKGWDEMFDGLDNCFVPLPIQIKAVEENKLYPTGTVLMTIENTDERFPWLTNYIETLLMKVWYPTTVATKAYYVKQVLQGAYEKSSDSNDVSFQYHNFGDRGSSSVESALIGGMAHLTQFSGTDNFNAVAGLKRYYGAKKGWSIPATEHSTVTSWGRDKEYDFYNHFLEVNKGAPIIACVMDSYDIYKAVDYITKGSFKAKVESDDYPVFVIRPDSGDPRKVLSDLLSIMMVNDVAYTVNSKGYKVFDKYRFIWGDGVSPKQILQIVNDMIDWGYSAENIAFGSGGDLMQKLDRDTCGFAIKASAAKVNGEWRDVFKDPVTDQGKRSKAGVQDSPELKTVFLNGTVTSNVAPIEGDV